MSRTAATRSHGQRLSVVGGGGGPETVAVTSEVVAGVRSPVGRLGADAPGRSRQPGANARECSVPGCDRWAHTRGFCKRHYMRWWRYGDPTLTADPAKRAHRSRQRQPELRRVRYADDDLAVFRWYSERLREDPMRFLRGADTDPPDVSGQA